MATNSNMTGCRVMVLVLLLVSVAHAGAGDPLRIPPADAAAIGERIWWNEGLGRVENLTVWNAGEDFPSFGIGHFIWYPADVDGPFEESFPALLERLASEGVALPAWLSPARPAPWGSREEFYDRIDSDGMRELRDLLRETVAHQVVFIVERMQAALPRMLDALPDDARRAHVETQFHRVTHAPNGIYALVDYVNFKGEGVAPRERYQGEGWGLVQVLEQMSPGAPDVMREFVRAADHVLTRRVANATRDETRWLPGWRKRLQTYLPEGTE